MVPVATAIKRRQRLVGATSLGVATLGLMLPLLTGAAARVEGYDWSSPAFVVFFGSQLAAVALGAVARRDRLGAVGLVTGAVLLASSLILAILCAPPKV
jgi:hypothetical protein